MSKKFFRALILLICLTLVAPFLNATKAFAATEPQIMGQSAITMDLDTGEIIYSKNADEQRSPASTTKLLTSLLFAENKNKDDLIPYTENSVSLRETTLNNFIGNISKSSKSTEFPCFNFFLICFIYFYYFMIKFYFREFFYIHHFVFSRTYFILYFSRIIVFFTHI